MQTEERKWGRPGNEATIMPLDSALMLLRERIGSEMLLLKQREVAEAFVSLLTNYIQVRTFASDAFL